MNRIQIGVTALLFFVMLVALSTSVIFTSPPNDVAKSNYTVDWKIWRLVDDN